MKEKQIRVYYSQANQCSHMNYNVLFLEGKVASPKLSPILKHAHTTGTDQHNTVATLNSSSMKQQHKNLLAKPSDLDKEKSSVLSIPSDAHCLTSSTGTSVVLAVPNGAQSTELLPTESLRVLELETAEWNGTSLTQLEPFGLGEPKWYSSTDIKPSSRFNIRPIQILKQATCTCNSSSTSFESAIDDMSVQQDPYITTPQPHECDSKLPMTSVSMFYVQSI